MLSPRRPSRRCAVVESQGDVKKRRIRRQNERKSERIRSRGMGECPFSRFHPMEYGGAWTNRLNNALPPLRQLSFVGALSAELLFRRGHGDSTAWLVEHDSTA